MAAEERKQVLEMLAAGKIGVDEAAKLLEAVESPASPTVIEEAGGGARKGRMLRVRVVEDGKQKVNVNVPFGLAKMFLGLAGKYAVKHEKIKDLDVDEIIRQVESGLTGKIVEVTDGNALVEVYVD